MTTTEAKVDNGVDVAFLNKAREILADQPAAADFTWRVSNTWVNGTHSRGTVNGFFGLGAEQQHRHQYTYDGDHPEVFSAEDNGPTPVELVLVSLAGCLTGGLAAIAQNWGIQLNSVTSSIEGKMDIRGILGVDSDIRNGFSDIKVTYDVDADASPEDIDALVAQAQKRSAVFDLITNPTNVTVEVDHGPRRALQRRGPRGH